MEFDLPEQHRLLQRTVRDFAEQEIAPVAEESHTPRRLIPLATIAITLLAGAFWTLSSYSFAIAVPPVVPG